MVVLWGGLFLMSEVPLYRGRTTGERLRRAAWVGRAWREFEKVGAVTQGRDSERYRRGLSKSTVGAS